MRITLWVVFLVLVCVGGCKENVSPNSNNQATDFYPLANGNSWSYFYAEYDSSNRIIDSSTSPSYVIGDSVILNRSMKWVWFEMNCFEANTDSGLVEVYGNPSTPSSVSFRLKYKYPILKGESYGNGCTVTSTDTMIIVPAGTFHCICYLFYQQGSTARVAHYVSPGIGLIKTAAFSTTLPGHITDGHQLVGYSVR